MGISEIKKRIVIDNYFKTECNINTSIREAFEKGFELGLEKAPKERKTDDIIDKIRDEIVDTGAYEQEVNGMTEFLKGITYCLRVIDEYRAEGSDAG